MLSVRPSFRPSVPTFQNLAKQNKVQARIVIATGGTVGLAEWIIDDTHVLFFIFSRLFLAFNPILILKPDKKKWGKDAHFQSALFDYMGS